MGCSSSPSRCQYSKDLQLFNCFAHTSPVINISTPKLRSLLWKDPYDLSTVHIDSLRQLRSLVTDVFHVYGQDDSSTHNRDHLISLLRRFWVIHTLAITLAYPQDIDDQYLMEDMTKLPQITFLELVVMSNGHAFGASSFHELRLCTGTRKLSLVLHTHRDSEAQFECPSGCICDQLTNWKIDELNLNRLQEIELTDLKGAEYEVTFVEQLFSWATVL